MKRKPLYWLIPLLALLIFIGLGFLVRSHPASLAGFDKPVQAFIRGSLPSGETSFFKLVTILGNTSTQVAIAIIAILLLLYKKWYADALYLGVNSALAAVCILSLKYLYQRPRPSISHLVYATGYSFPSGHSMGTFLIIGSILVIAHQHLQAKAMKWIVALILGMMIFLVGLSRIYLGVHYPTDVLAGFTLALGVHYLVYPYYDKWRQKK